MASEENNRQHYKDAPLHEVEDAFYAALRKGFNMGFSAWLLFPYYRAELHIRDGKMMMKGKEHKGNLYTNEEYEDYRRLGMLP